MGKMNEVKEFAKEHKKAIAIGAITLVGGAVTAVTIKQKFGWLGKYKYRTIFCSNNKGYMESFIKWANWMNGAMIDSSGVGIAMESDDLKKHLEEFMGENANDYIYGVIIEKLKKPE